MAHRETCTFDKISRCRRNTYCLLDVPNLKFEVASQRSSNFNPHSLEDLRLESFRPNFQSVIAYRQRGNLVSSRVVGDGRTCYTDRVIGRGDFSSTDQSAALISN